MKGSDKAFNFCYRGEGDRLLSLKPPLTCSLSSACSKRRGRSRAICHWAAWEKKPCCVSSLTAPNIKTVYLCLDSDQAGNDRLQPPCGACAGGLDRPPPCARFTRTGTRYCSTGQNHRREVYPGSGLRIEEPPQEKPSRLSA